MDRKEKKRLFLSSVSTIEEGVPLVLHDNVTDNKAIEPDQDKGNESNNKALLMLPPSGSMKKQKVTQKKVVLDEDEYINTLGEIIEQKYYPNTKEYKLQLALIEAEANNKFLESSIITDEINRQKMESNNEQQHQLDTFFNNYTSQDNESFKQLHQKDLAAHRSRFHWAYESNDPNKKQGMLMWYHLDDNTVLTSNQRNQMEKILNGDNSSSNKNQQLLLGSDTAKFQVRNSFMFPPDEQIVKPDGSLGSSHSDLLMITDVGKSDSKKTIIASNTRFNNIDDDALLMKHRFSRVSPLEEPHTPSIYSTSDFSDTDSFKSHPRNKKKEYKLIPMTPIHIPNVGSNASSVTFHNPLMYEMQPLSTRDNIIQNMETKCVKKPDKHASRIGTSKKQLQPAAALLVNKIKTSNNDTTPFGGAFSSQQK